MEPMTQARSPVPRRRLASAIPVGRPFGIPVYFSPSWFLIAAYITVVTAEGVGRAVDGIGAARYLVAFAFAVLLALSVLAHELGHCAVSRGLGLPVRRVTIFLLGGVSEIDKEPETAAREYLVAMAGPLVSLLLAGIGAALIPVFDGGTVARVLCVELTIANGLVAAFNLLPGLPLDGGRVLRAAAWQLSSSRVTGTKAGAYAGRAVAVLVVAGALFGASGPEAVPSLLFAALLAGFIWVGAGQALRAAEVSSRLPAVAAGRLARRALGVAADLPLSEALRRAEEAGAGGLVVVDADGRPGALVSEAAVAATPSQRRPWVPVGSLARTIDEGLVLRADLVGNDVLDAMRTTPASEYLVIDAAGVMVGVLSTADVASVVDPRAPARPLAGATR